MTPQSEGSSELSIHWCDNLAEQLTDKLDETLRLKGKFSHKMEVRLSILHHVDGGNGEMLVPEVEFQG